MKGFVVGLSLLFLTVPSLAQEAILLNEIREHRLRGALTEAQTLAEQALQTHAEALADEVAFRLELARIHDRLGLHNNTRPVAAALEQIEVAASRAENADAATQAHISLAFAEYHYRAEMRERVFATATHYAEQAVEQFQQLGDVHGEAEAVHRLGLIELQRRNLDEAHVLFDRSLQLDQAGGERTFFLGEYGRHVGFVYLLKGDYASALPYFEQSLVARRKAGAIDASLFAANTLAGSLIALGRTADAFPHLMYGMMVAEQINSPMGKARIGLNLGRLYEQDGDLEAARLAFEMTHTIATAIGSSMAQQAEEALERLVDTTQHR